MLTDSTSSVIFIVASFSFFLFFSYAFIFVTPFHHDRLTNRNEYIHILYREHSVVLNLLYILYISFSGKSPLPPSASTAPATTDAVQVETSEGGTLSYNLNLTRLSSLPTEHNMMRYLISLFLLAATERAHAAPLQPHLRQSKGGVRPNIVFLVVESTDGSE